MLENVELWSRHASFLPRQHFIFWKNCPAQKFNPIVASTVKLFSKYLQIPAQTDVVA